MKMIESQCYEPNLFPSVLVGLKGRGEVIKENAVAKRF